jgi:3-phytase
MKPRAIFAASALALLGACTISPAPATVMAPKLVHAFAETDPVASAAGEDAADDRAIWVNVADPVRSLVFGASQKKGQAAYDLADKRVQSLPVGMLNNADLRQQVDMGFGPVDVMGAADRTNNSLALFGIDHMPRASEPKSNTPTGMGQPSCFCIGADAKAFIAAISYKDGQIQIWRIENSKPTPKAVWKLASTSEAECCLIDEENGAIFVFEEDVGFWRITYSGETETGRTMIDKVGSSRGLFADAEGATILRGKNGGWYVIVSSQENNRYIVNDRKAPNAVRGSFAIVDGKVDGTTHTDGTEATSTPLGPNLPHGLFVAQGDENPGSTQNFKLVDWREIERALGLE